MAHPPNLRELAAELDSIAQQDRAVVERYTGDVSLPEALELAPLAGEIAGTVQRP